jgi:serine/threonine protein kinase
LKLTFLISQEAKFLASISHPNIIKLRGMAAAGTSGFSTMQERGYFLLLDRLQCTLEHKIDHWRNFDKALSLEGKKRKGFLAERLHVAFDVAAALSYLHRNNIIYRDLKPDNIGFDIRGDVKIFDFGLAKELDPSLRLHGCTEFYELSGNTGSLRYMAPEVARSEPYNLTADVYSFGLLLWQVCALDLPYDGMNRQDHSELVVHGNERPPLDSDWSTPLRILMKRAWEPDPSVRPSMDSIYKILKREICALRDGDESGLEHNSRRSTFVLNRDSAANPSGRDDDFKATTPEVARKSIIKQGSVRGFGMSSQRGDSLKHLVAC